MQSFNFFFFSSAGIVCILHICSIKPQKSTFNDTNSLKITKNISLKKTDPSRNGQWYNFFAILIFFFFFILGLRRESNSATRHVVFWVMDMTHFSPTGRACPPPSLFLVPSHAGSITCRWIYNIHCYGFSWGNCRLMWKIISWSGSGQGSLSWE